MKFREALEYVRQQLELHPERYEFYRDDVPHGKTVKGCLMGLAFEGAGLASCGADIHQIAGMMESTHPRFDIEDTLYDLMDKQEELLIRDENFEYWRDNAPVALACLSAVLASGPNPDLDQEVPTPEQVDDEYPADEDDDNDDWDDDNDDTDEEDEDD